MAVGLNLFQHISAANSAISSAQLSALSGGEEILICSFPELSPHLHIQVLITATSTYPPRRRLNRLCVPDRTLQMGRQQHNTCHGPARHGSRISVLAISPRISTKLIIL
jgi:hypothetical protein